MKNKKSRRKSVVAVLLFASGAAFIIEACAPIVAEFGVGKPVTLTSAEKGDAR